MLHLALSADEHDAYLRALTQTHAIRADVRIHDRNEREISSLTTPQSRLVSGAVQVDATASVTRSFEGVFVDPNRTMQFEADSPADGAVYAKNFISVRYEVRVEELGAWVVVPIFWGILTAFERAGGVVTIEAQGKEALMLEPHFAGDGYTIPRRMRLDEAIAMVARRAGERRFDLPELDHKLGRAHTVHPKAEPWKVLNGGKRVKGLRRALEIHPRGQEHGPVGGWHAAPGLISHAPGDRRAYYNGHGDLVVRRKARSVSFVFREGVHLTGEPPQVTHDLADVRNRVVVTGGKPKGKPRAHGAAHLPAANPLSPAALARNGEPRRMTEFVEAEGLQTDKKCRKRAREVLHRLARESIEAQFTTLPIPHLEEADHVALRTDEGYVSFPLRQFTIPLSAADGNMSINFLRRVRMGPTRRRRPHRPNHHIGFGRGHHR